MRDELKSVDVVPVSIHAPREGCDCASLLLLLVVNLFQFTHPGRGATMRTRQ